MSYPRNMAGAVALMALSSMVGLGCMAGADDQSNDDADQTIVADDATKVDEKAPGQESAAVVADKADKEVTGESKDALWGRGFGWGGGFGRGLGWGGYRGYGRGFYGGFGRGLGWGGYGGLYGGYGLGYGGYGLGYGLGYGYGYGYPVYGYGGCVGGC